MELKKKFSDDKIARILDQSLIYQCACPAQVCKSVIGLRELYAYQQQCLNRTDTDVKVHGAIAKSAATSHEEMEICLEEILKIEGWDLEKLEMPENLKKIQKELL